MTTPGHGYRADIDGLRAVAIIPVVLFHANLPGVSGGYVGVDVFFVISGFLITSIIAGELDRGDFSIVKFYERRLRRLMPSLMAVLLASLVAGYIWMTPTDYADLNKGALHTLFFVSNFHFSLLGGYFDQPLSLAPLLHTWSLAVEEQFYIFWPPLLWALTRYARRIRLQLVLFLLFASLTAAVWLVSRGTSETFYWPHARAWELLIGAVVALGLVRAPPTQRLADGASILGLAMIVVAVVGYDEDIPFPGIAAIPPTLGAALVIWAGLERPSRAGSWLASRPLVFVGLISYALYLWHWPLFAFFRLQTGHDPSAFQSALLIGLALALAAACWHFLEKPARRRQGAISTSRIVAFATVATASISSFAVLSQRSEGFVDRFPPEIRAYSKAAVANPDSQNCVDTSPCKIYQGRSDRPAVLLWGDSHAGALTNVFGKLAREAERTLYVAWLSVCPPLLEVSTSKKAKQLAQCSELHQRAIALLGKERFGDVVLASRWDFYLAPLAEANIEDLRRKVFLRDVHSGEISIAANYAVAQRGLDRTISAIHAASAQAWVIETVPAALANVPNLLARTVMRGGDPSKVPPFDLRLHHKRSAVMKSLLAPFAAGGRIRVLDPSVVLCPDGSCPVQRDGRPLYFDDDHLSAFGSLQLSGLLRPIFALQRESNTLPTTITSMTPTPRSPR